MKLVFISDTHNKHNELTIPECDILFHTGDWSFQGKKSEVTNFAKWINKQPAKHIVVIPGNHDVAFESGLGGCDTDLSSRSWFTDHCERCHLLVHEALTLEGLKIFGSPWTPYFNDWAFNAGRTITEAAHLKKPFIGDLWKDIPTDTQILLTHGPALGKLDVSIDYDTGRLDHAGCRELLKKTTGLPHLKIHAFGHLHYQGGMILEENNIKFINAAVCGDSYNIHQSRIIEIEL